MIILDTDVCVAILRQNPIIKARRDREKDELAISPMTAAELYFGAEKSSRWDMNLMQVEEFLGTIDVLEFDENTIRTFGYVKAYLSKGGVAIPDADLIVAATALSRSCPLASGNVRHFSRIWGLQLQNWFEQPAHRR